MTFRVEAAIKDTSIIPYTKLAIAVIKQAIEDATHDPPVPAPTLKWYDDEISKYKQHLNDRDDARTFLTTDNVSLRAWCSVAGLNVHTVLHYSKGAATDWVALGQRFNLHPIHGRKPSGQESAAWPPDANLSN